MFLLAVFWCAGGVCRASISSSANVQSQTLSGAGQVQLRDTIQSGTFVELRWPNFRKYQHDVAAFYQNSDYALPWINNMQPTKQALAAVAILEEADEKGLSAEDYDGPRWAERVQKLRPQHGQPTESDAIHFDLALTISLMRYVSDLHKGRIDRDLLSMQSARRCRVRGSRNPSNDPPSL